MATIDYDYTDGVVGAQISETAALHFVNQHTIVDLKTNALGSGELARIFNVPKGTKVHQIEWKVTTVEGATLTFDIGDYLDSNDNAVNVDGWVNGANGNSLASGNSDPVITQGTPSTIAPLYGLGKWYSTDNWIGLKVIDAADAAVIEVWMVASQAQQAT